VIGKTWENPPPLVFPFWSFGFGFFGTRHIDTGGQARSEQKRAASQKQKIRDQESK
jgi:hypothetical protein